MKIDDMIAELKKQLEQATASANYFAGQIAALEMVKKLGAVIPEQSKPEPPGEC